MDEQNNGAGKNEFNLWFLLRYLERMAGRRLQRMRCVSPSVCAHDVAMDLVYSKNCLVLGDKVWLNFPRAIVQMAVLHTELRHKVFKKKRTCQNCGLEIIPIVEERGSDDLQHGPSASPVDPATPETLLEKKEMIERVLAELPDDWQREAFKAKVLYGFSHEEIAALLGVKPARVRQWYSRNLALLQERFPDVESLWAK